ncbi:MAG: hypothetical protein Q9162_007516 [Coniocarpon cinnabarinum]
MTDISGGGRLGPSNDEATRGRPYYEKLRSDLRACIDKKLKNDRQLQAVEMEIAQTEEEYLESTAAAGNIIKGFDNYIKASSASTMGTSGPGTATRRKGGVMDQDRIFSRSSTTWNLPARKDIEPINTASANARSKGLDSASIAGGGSVSGSARDTPTTSTAGTGKAGSKAKKKGSQGKQQDDDDDSERPAKRNKISWGRD